MGVFKGRREDKIQDGIACQRPAAMTKKVIDVAAKDRAEAGPGMTSGLRSSFSERCPGRGGSVHTALLGGPAGA